LNGLREEAGDAPRTALRALFTDDASGTDDLPPDCPEGAAYIHNSDKGRDFVLHPIAPFPLVIEGGEGEDNVTVVGTPRNPVIIDGGKGNDSVIVQDRVTWLAGRLSPESVVILAALLIVFATIGLLGWRALSTRPARDG
jgi:hypothetical protein